MDIEDRILALRGEIAVLQKEVSRLSVEATKTCKHRYAIEYGWVSDDGYGGLVSRIGKRCQTCGRFDYWGNGKWEE